MVIHIYNNLRQYARAVDVFVQCEPTIAAIVWGSVRVLLQAGAFIGLPPYLVVVSNLTGLAV